MDHFGVKLIEGGIHRMFPKAVAVSYILKWRAWIAPKRKVSFCERDGFGEAVKIQMAKLCALEATLGPNSLQGNKTDVIGIEAKKFQFWC